MKFNVKSSFFCYNLTFLYSTEIPSNKKTCFVFFIFIDGLNATNSLGSRFFAISGLKNVLFVKLAQPIRIDLTGSFISPDIFKARETLGNDIVLDRLERAAEYLKNTKIVDPY